MAKRKRTFNASEAALSSSSTIAAASKKVKPDVKPESRPDVPSKLASRSSPLAIQIIAGSYDRILHGITATIPEVGEAEFADTFLFTAHTSAIRCLALSPPSALVPGQTQKIILASGSTDLYHLSAHPPRKSNKPKLPSLTSNAVIENPQNKELGSLLHHASSVTALCFPTRSKLLSSAEDSTIAVTRTRDWSLLSTIKAPIPKPQGRPSGDTAPLGGTPAGVNDFSVHPSLKLMISVGKGEKCMRLWNLVTGKKAGVLNFGREMLSEAGEGRFGSGEGRKVAWGNTDAGEEFCVGFEWGALIFGMDSKPRCKVAPTPKTKIHQLSYITLSEDDDVSILAMSTEDGRILFYSTNPNDLTTAAAVAGKEAPLPAAKLVAQLGGNDTGVSGRIKDFTTLKIDDGSLLIVTANSDGTIRLWRMLGSDLKSHETKIKQVGTVIGTYETGNRITCLQAFIMLPLPEGAKYAEEEVVEVEQNSDSSDSDSE